MRFYFKVFGCALEGQWRVIVEKADVAARRLYSSERLGRGASGTGSRSGDNQGRLGGPQQNTLTNLSGKLRKGKLPQLP
jgi:hypothetical protein